MRITSQLFPEAFKTQLQDVLEKQYKSQAQAATGLKFTKASEDPVSFEAAQQAKTNQFRDEGYINATGVAETAGQYAYQGMSDLMTLMNRASELVTRASGAANPEDIQIVGKELSSVLDQIVSVANRQVDGNYLFGGTGNVAPITITAGNPPAYAYNSSSSYTSNVQQIQINTGYTINVGMVAGSTNGSGFSGFLYDGTTDVLATLSDIRDDLLAGTSPTSAQLKDSTRSVNVVANSVGLAAATLQSVDINNSRLQNQVTNNKTQINTLTNVSLTDALNDLQQSQLNYQAALQSGSQILNLSLLNYLR